MQHLICTVREVDGLVVVETAGEIDLAVADRWRAAIEAGITAGAHVVLDCSAITFMDSMGLRVLVQVADLAKETGAELTLAACSAPVLRVIEVAGLDGMFAVAGPEILPSA
jgi:stage II sporulation protein AA (anti-sigma F factor antagonist)